MEKDDIGAILRNPETPATVLLFILIDSLGVEFFDWEPTTLDHEIWAAWKVTVPQDNKDKIWALVTVLTTNLFYQNLNCFNHVCGALNNAGADFSTFDPASVSDMAWAVAEIVLLDPPDPKDPTYQFSDEISGYMSAELGREGFTKPPRILSSYVKPLADEAQLNDVLEGDGIEYKSYWDDQNQKRIDVDRYVGQKLADMLKTLSQLPLKNVDSKALQELEQRATKVLVQQSKQLEEASENSSRRPQL